MTPGPRPCPERPSSAVGIAGGRGARAGAGAAAGAGGGGGGGEAKTAPGARELLDAALEAFDPLQQGGRVVVRLGMGEPDDGDLEGDPGVEGVAHGDHRRPEHLHGADAPGRPEQQTALHSCGTRSWRLAHACRRRGRVALPRQARGHGGQELGAQLVEKRRGDTGCVPTGDESTLDRLQGAPPCRARTRRRAARAPKGLSSSTTPDATTWSRAERASLAEPRPRRTAASTAVSGSSSSASLATSASSSARTSASRRWNS